MICGFVIISCTFSILLQSPHGTARLALNFIWRVKSKKGGIAHFLSIAVGFCDGLHFAHAACSEARRVDWGPVWLVWMSKFAVGLQQRVVLPWINTTEVMTSAPSKDCYCISSVIFWSRYKAEVWLSEVVQSLCPFSLLTFSDSNVLAKLQFR